MKGSGLFMVLLNNRKRKARNRGLALIAALLVLMVLSFAMAGVNRYVLDMQRFNERTIAREHALLTAEAGLYKCMCLVNTPDDLLPIEDPEDAYTALNDFWEAADIAA